MLLSLALATARPLRRVAAANPLPACWALRRHYRATAASAMSGDSCSFQGPGSDALRGMSCAGLCSK